MRQQSRVVVKAKLRARQRAAVKAAGGYCWVGANVVGGGGEQSADGDAAGLGAGGGERVLAAVLSRSYSQSARASQLRSSTAREQTDHCGTIILSSLRADRPCQAR